MTSSLSSLPGNDPQDNREDIDHEYLDSLYPQGDVKEGAGICARIAKVLKGTFGLNK